MKRYGKVEVLVTVLFNSTILNKVPQSAEPKLYLRW